MATRTIMIAAAAGLLVAFAAPAKAHDDYLAVSLNLGSTWVHFVDGGTHYYAPRRFVHDRRYWYRHPGPGYRHFPRQRHYGPARRHHHDGYRRARYRAHDYDGRHRKGDRNHRRSHRRH